MSSTLRIKVEYVDSNKEDSAALKFVYLIDSAATTTIDKLITALQEFIITHFGCHNLHLVQLATDDGYILMKHNVCAQVLQNNEKLVCVDMGQFFIKNRRTFNIEEAWLNLNQHDASDNIKKSLAIGINDAGKLYVFLWGGKGMRELYLFNISQLLAMAQDKHKEIEHLSMKISVTSPSEWFISAQWVHDSTSSNSLFLIGSLKTGDTTDILSNKLRINLNESTKTIEKGEVISLSNPSKEDATQVTEQKQARLEVLKKTIPPPSRTGPVLNTDVSNATLTKYECEGDSPIRLMQGKESFVDVQQDTFAHDGSFRNFITITDIIISKKTVVLPEILTQKRSAPAEKPISIAQVHVQYQRDDGKWIECQDAKIEITSTGQDDRRTIVTSILNIEPDKLISVSIHASIRVKGSPNKKNTTRSRAHRSLPQPLKLKILVTDNQSKTCSLVVEQINEPLTLITKESWLQNNEDKLNQLIAFVYADDCEYDERIYTTVYIDKEHCLIIEVDGRYAIMNTGQIRTMQFNAKKSKKTEELIDFVSDSEIKAISLFDPETFLFYAIRIELTTTTSKTIETVLIPLDALK